MLTQNVTLLTSAIEVSSSNHREKTELSEVLVFLSFPQENPGKYLEMGYKIPSTSFPNYYLLSSK
jgi:hypothetical protein